jgi:hypothetical protein
MSLGQPKNQLELAELVASLGDENAQIRYFAGASLTRLGGLATVNMLAAYLQTNPTDLSRGEALKVLGMIGEMSEEPDVRTTAIQALATENS